MAMSSTLWNNNIDEKPHMNADQEDKLIIFPIK